MSKLPEFMAKRVLEHSMSTLDYIEAKKGMQRNRYLELYHDFEGDAGSTLPMWLVYTDELSSGGSIAGAYVADARFGEYTITHSNDNEEQQGVMSSGNQLMLPSNGEPFFEARVKINTGASAFSADQRAVIGLAGVRGSGDIEMDAVARNCWFRIEGANWNILTEADDTVTDTDDQDSGLDLADNTYACFKIHITAAGVCKFFVDLEDGVGYRKAGADITAAAFISSAANMQPYISMEKDAGTETEVMTIDFIRVGCKRF